MKEALEFYASATTAQLAEDGGVFARYALGQYDGEVFTFEEEGFSIGETFYMDAEGENFRRACIVVNVEGETITAVEIQRHYLARALT